MPWRESSVIEERLRFVVAASRKEKRFGELCREFGISRPTGYMWLKRYQEGGASQVQDRSRRPLSSPGRTATEIEQALVSLRQRWPDWGAPKLLTVLLQDHPESEGLSVRTAHRILQRRQLVISPAHSGCATKRFERAAPNELWQMDFKGPGGGSSTPIGPLSVLDDHSRFVLVLEQLGSTQLVGVQRKLLQTFEECGLPEAMLMDHGTPWWNAMSPWGLTELSVWIMRQGIRLLFSRIRHPQTQGKVERMHGALARATYRRRQDLAQQQWLDEFRQEYNYVRPHEALEMKTPSTRWKRSTRIYQPAPPEWEYPGTMEIRELAGEGQLNFRGRRWEISNALRRQKVGLCQIEDRAIVYFCATPIRELNLTTGKSVPILTDPLRVTPD